MDLRRLNVRFHPLRTLRLARCVSRCETLERCVLNPDWSKLGWPDCKRDTQVDYELAYVTRRAAEERQAADAPFSGDEREKHLMLARLFEEHAARLPEQDA